MIADSVALPRGRGQARASSTPSTSSTATPTTPSTRWPALRAAVDAGAERVVLCDTNGGVAAGRRSRASSARSSRRCRTVAVGIHCHNDAELRRRELARRRRGGRDAGAGHDERRRRAHRQREPRLDHRRAAAQARRSTVLAAERLARLTEIAHFADELLNRAPDPDQPYVGQATRSPTRPGCTPRACAARRARSSTSTRRSSATATTSSSPSSPAARRSSRRPRPPASRSTRRGVLERVKALEHAGYQFEAADGSFELLLRKEAGVYEPLFRLESWRCIVEQRADGKVETEATIKIWVDGERYVRTAEGNGPVNALDARAARRRSPRSTRTCATSSS